MKSSSNQKLGRNFVWFSVGIACGIFISVFLFLAFASTSVMNQIWFHSSVDHYDNPPVIKVRFDKSSNQKADGMVVHERKLSQDTSMFDQDSNGNFTIPIDAQRDAVPIQNPSWEQSLTPRHIPGFLTQELKLKKKVFVALVHPNVESNPVFDLVFETWGKDWVSKGNGEITVYSPIGLNLKESDGVNTYRLSASTSNPNEISPTIIYQVLSDICSQHIDTHHHFYIVNSNTYVNLPRLLNFTNRLDDSVSMWIGTKVHTDGKDKVYTNDPNFHCSEDGFLLTRHALQRLCPYLSTCQLEYSEARAPSGLQFARCVLRFLNQTCTYTSKYVFYKSNGNKLVDPYSEKCPFKESVSVHPVVDENALMKLHHFYLARQLNETKKLNEYYHNIIQSMDRVLVQEGGMADDRLILGREGNANKYQHGDVISWDKIEVSDEKPGKIYIADGPEPSRDLTKADQEVLKKVAALSLSKMKEEFGSDEGLSVSNAFRRVVPGVGFQYMVDVQKNKEEVATVFIDQPYDRMRALSTHFAPNVIVNFVLPLQDGSPHFKEFMQMFEQACMSVERAKDVALLVVLYFTKSNESKHVDEKNSETLSLLNLYKQKYPDLSLRWINGGEEAFSHIQGVSMAVRALPADTLICSTSLFIQMSPEFLHHARLNTVLGERLFFPAPFQELNSDEMRVKEISKYSGFWRSFDYSFFCGYKQDISRACGGEAFSSGADLYERALSSGLDVFRSPEHSLAVRWHERDCESTFLSRAEKLSCEVETKNVNLLASSLRH